MAHGYDSRLLSGVNVLMAVVEAGTMARAAEALALSPSGVGRAIARLEARIGVRLLERTTRSLHLTDEGRIFFDQVGPHLAAIEEAAMAAAGAAGIVRGRLRINVAPIVSQALIAPRIGEFLALHPELRVEMILRDAVGDLVADGFDMAVRFAEPPPSFVARKLADLRVITAAAPSYIARRGRPAHPTDLADHDTIDFWDPVRGRPYDWEFQRAEETLAVQPRARLMTSDAATMLAACCAGVGICQLPTLGAESLFARGALVDLFPDWPGETFPLYVLYPPRQARSAKVRAFIAFLASVVADRDAPEARSPLA